MSPTHAVSPLAQTELSQIAGGGESDLWPTTRLLAVIIGETIDLFVTHGSSEYGRVMADHM